MSPLTWKLFMTQGQVELTPSEKRVALDHNRFLDLREKASAAIDEYGIVCEKQQREIITAICSLSKTRQELEAFAAERHKTVEVSRAAAIAAVDAEHAAWVKIKDAEKLLNESQ